MCLILFAWRVHPRFPLVVAANRDEFFARPTAAAAFWHDRPGLLAGRDLEAGGTWMGITHRGRFAALTNYRDPGHQKAGRPSRGLLVADFLHSPAPAHDTLLGLAAQGAACNGYNLLAGDSRALYWGSNITGELRELPPGLYGLSNHLLDTPWPKVDAGRTALAAALPALPDLGPLFDLLADDRIFPDERLPATGVPLDWERRLSAAFIRSPDYGTRCSTALAVGADGTVMFEEQTWLRHDERGERRRFRIQSQ